MGFNPVTAQVWMSTGSSKEFAKAHNKNPITGPDSFDEDRLLAVLSH